MSMPLLFLYFFHRGKIGGKLPKLFQGFESIKYQMARQSLSYVINLYNHTAGEHVQEVNARNLMKGLPNLSIMRLIEPECTLMSFLTALCFDYVHLVVLPDKLKASGEQKYKEMVPLLQVRCKWHFFSCPGTKSICFLTTTNLQNTSY